MSAPKLCWFFSLLSFTHPIDVTIKKQANDCHGVAGSQDVHTQGTFQEEQEGDALCVKDLLDCMELLTGMGNRLDELLWVRVIGEAGEGRRRSQ